MVILFSRFIIGAHGYKNVLSDAELPDLPYIAKGSSPLHFVVHVHEFLTSRIIKNSNNENIELIKKDAARKESVLTCGKLLIESGADTSIQNHDGLNPFHYANVLKNSEMISLFKSYRGYTQKLKRKVDRLQSALDLKSNSFKSAASEIKNTVDNYKLLLKDKDDELEHLKEELNSINDYKLKMIQLEKDQENYNKVLLDYKSKLDESESNMSNIQFKYDALLQKEKGWKDNIQDLQDSLKNLNGLYEEEKRIRIGDSKSKLSSKVEANNTQAVTLGTELVFIL